MEHDESVVTDAAVDRQRLAGAVAQPALCGVDRREHVFGRYAGKDRRSARLVELADLEEVVALTAVDGDSRTRVVDVKLVVTVAAVDGDRLHVLVVVQALHRIRPGGSERSWPVDQGDERQASVCGGRPHQEDVRVVRAVDGEHVRAVRGGARIEHVDQRAGSTADQVHGVRIAAPFPVQRDDGVDAVGAQRGGATCQRGNRLPGEGADEVDRVLEGRRPGGCSDRDVGLPDRAEQFERRLNLARGRVVGDRNRRLDPVHARRSGRTAGRTACELVVEEGGAVRRGIRALSVGRDTAIDAVARRTWHIAPIELDGAVDADGLGDFVGRERLEAGGCDGRDHVVVRVWGQRSRVVGIGRQAQRLDVICEVEAESSSGHAWQCDGLDGATAAGADHDVGCQCRPAGVGEVVDVLHHIRAAGLCDSYVRGPGRRVRSRRSRAGEELGDRIANGGGRGVPRDLIADHARAAADAESKCSTGDVTKRDLLLLVLAQDAVLRFGCGYAGVRGQ